MSNAELERRFGLKGKTAIVTGGSGVLGTAMAQGLAQAGASVAVLSRRLKACEAVAEEIRKAGGEALAVRGDVLDKVSLESAAAQTQAALGPVDILINAAGGNQPGASTTPELAFFDLDAGAVSEVIRANFTGTFFACQVFGRAMAERGAGVIVNFSSMSAARPLTRVAAYGAAKAALENFTRWLAVHMAQEYSTRIRVNALAPGFFLTGQNRYLLIDEKTGGWTERGAKIIGHTPMGRLGVPDDLLGPLLWLVGPGSEFVTGIVLPVDGGFSAYSGV
jgi:NAD(P)-dependent dehydrogenase (short-subunit alcohol dehydrogenase family)